MSAMKSQDILLLFKLATNQLGLLLGLVAALFSVAQFTVRIFKSQLRNFKFLVNAQAFIQQLFKFKAQLFKRGFALLQIKIELFTLLSQALGLHFKPFKGLTGGIVLRFE